MAVIDNVTVPTDTSELVNSLMAEKAGQTTQTTTVQNNSFEVPEKFKGKTTEDVIKSYLELESTVGKQGQELGELRKAADNFIRQPSPIGQGGNGQTVEHNRIDFDSLEEPEKIKAVIERELNPIRNELLETKREKLLAKLSSNHPDHVQIVNDPEFQQWVMKSPVRLEMFARADHNFEYEAADELFTTYKAIKGIATSNEAKEVAKQEAAKAFTQSRMETGSVEDTAPKARYRRADLIQLKIKDPARYAALEPEIMRAYQEGRVY